nr:MAG TPA: hypothetical protein [Caudoviricetes sp.]
MFFVSFFLLLLQVSDCPDLILYEYILVLFLSCPGIGLIIALSIRDLLLGSLPYNRPMLLYRELFDISSSPNTTFSDPMCIY